MCLHVGLVAASYIQANNDVSGKKQHSLKLSYLHASWSAVEASAGQIRVD